VRGMVEMHQGGILATGSRDKTLKVQVLPSSHPTQFVPSFVRSFLYFFPTHGHWRWGTHPIKYWALQSSAPLATAELKDRYYAMDVKNQVLVVGTAG